MITEQHQEEALSAAYISACAARAGCNMKFSQHDYGVDGSLVPVRIFGHRRLELGFPVDFQAKASMNWEQKEGLVIYDLQAKAFNDFVRRRNDGGNPYILILLCLPKERTQWLEMGPDHLILRHFCYWHHLSDEGATENEETRRIRIPVTQRLMPDEVVRLLQMARSGELK